MEVGDSGGGGVSDRGRRRRDHKRGNGETGTNGASDGGALLTAHAMGRPDRTRRHKHKSACRSFRRLAFAPSRAIRPPAAASSATDVPVTCPAPVLYDKLQ